MTSEWIGMANALALDEAIGNALAGAIGADVGDNLTFTKGRLVRKISDHSQTARFAQVPLKQSGIDRIAEFNTVGPYPLLNEAGVPNEMIATGKANVIAEAGLRADIKNRWQQFLAEQGYEIIPEV